ncbi:MAG: phosphopentomutase [Lentisphaerae bacterium]|nr:phosphopentomutase [Lentisphaerota bacterium]
MSRALLIVLDSVGIGAAPDAGVYGDTGANTLAHIGEAVGGLRLPVMAGLGLGHIPALLPGGLPIPGVPAAARPRGDFGALQEVSVGKDTTTGHWELAGLLLEKGFRVFPPQAPSFPDPLIRTFAERTGRGILGNKAASGTAIIQELGEAHRRTGRWIVYTSADSVFQLAAHEETVPLQELYRACTVARELCNPYNIGRVIARPFTGPRAGAFTRTENRRDYAMPPPEPTLLDRLQQAGVPTTTVGKLDDVFAHRGIDRACHVENNPGAEAALLEWAAQGSGFVFGNLIDFDMLYGHRRDPRGYANALEQADRFLGALITRLTPDDLLIVTADHGNDPTFRGTDHTREYVPLLVHHAGSDGRSLGVRRGFYDAAASVAAWFGLPPLPRGTPFTRGPV